MAGWRIGEIAKLYPPNSVKTLLRAVVTKNRHNLSAYALHSLRAGGATSLYRDTCDIDLVATFGRWKTNSISAYLWESHQKMTGISDHVVVGDHVLHTSAQHGETDPVCTNSRC